MSATVFDNGLGDFTALKREAVDANARSRRDHGDEVSPETRAFVREVEAHASHQWS